MSRVPGTQMRVLYWDRSGWCIWAKRLEQGRFISDWANLSTRRMDFTGLKLLLEGIEPRQPGDCDGRDPDQGWPHRDGQDEGGVLLAGLRGAG